MTIDFDPSRWTTIREIYNRWWSGTLDRPIVPVTLTGRDPGRAEPPAPLLSQANCHELSVPAEEIVDRWDYELSQQIYLGDAFPWVNLDAFGPGILAAMLGARLDNSSGRVWFFAACDVPIADLHFEVDTENVWLRRIKDLCRAAIERWEGQVLVGMTDLGGNLDILAAFRPAEKLLLDLYDHPDEVKRLTWEAHSCWHQVFATIHGVLQPANPGYTDWSGIYSADPSYMLQCDFGYMIGPAMFDEFAKPELEATCQQLSQSFYHLDGRGQLPHLDSLLRIESLDGVQWVPGAGRPGCAHWPEVYCKIHAAGKRIQLIDGDFDTLDAVIAQIDAAGPIHHIGIRGQIEEEAAMRRKLARYRIE